MSQCSCRQSASVCRSASAVATWADVSRRRSAALSGLLKPFFFFSLRWWLQYCVCVLTPHTSNWGNCHYVLLRSLPPPLLMWNAWPCFRRVQINKRNKKIFADDSKWSEKISCLLKKKKKKPLTTHKEVWSHPWPFLSASVEFCAPLGRVLSAAVRNIFWFSFFFFSRRCKRKG